MAVAVTTRKHDCAGEAREGAGPEVARFLLQRFLDRSGQQFKPKAREKSDHPQLKTAIHDYTRDNSSFALARGRTAGHGATGNEINGGMLWPEGKAGGRAAASLTVWPDCSTPRLRAKRESDRRRENHAAHGPKD